MGKKLLFMLCLSLFRLGAQEKPIKIEEKEMNNRLAFYALNETHTDYDVLFTVKGSNFRQSAAKPRLIRVPSASKVHLKTIILFRDKKPTYTYTVKANDSLSRRAVRKEYTTITIPPKKIKPKKHVTIYTTSNCGPCNQIVDSLTQNNYIFRHYDLNENLKIKEQLQKTYASSPSVTLDSLQKPVVNLGGRLYTWIESYGQLLEELDKE